MSFLKSLTQTTFAACIAASPIAAHAGTFTSLYSFTGGNDGGSAFDRLSLRNGQLYGTAFYDGANGDGVLFKVDPNAGGETVLHAFSGTSDGASPFAHLTLVKKVLYGTTAYGGANNDGTIFSYNPKTGAVTTLYSFSGTDGSGVVAGVVYSDGALWGATDTGGANNDGTLFKYDIASGTLTTVHSFGGTNDGVLPLCNPVLIAGVFYGVTIYGGAANDGMVYSFNPSTGVENVLYNFTGAADGANPVGELMYQNGLLYGTAEYGGASGNGVVFSLNAKTGAESPVYTFSGGADGGVPVASLVAINGVLYGAAEHGGANGYGTLYSVTTAGVETTLYTFTNGADGAYPWAGMIARGNTLYGTTIGLRQSGSNGSVFKYVP